MISRTKMKARTRKKTNPEIVETLREALKYTSWGEVAKLLSSSTKRYISVDLFDIEKNSEEGDTLIIIGKVLSGGELKKRVRICALAISMQAREKLKESKSEYVSVLEEIKKNPKAEGIKILRLREPSQRAQSVLGSAQEPDRGIRGGFLT